MVRPRRHRLAAGVALTEVLIAFNMGEKNKILMFLPIVEVVALAWAISEVLGRPRQQLKLRQLASDAVSQYERSGL